LAEAPAPNPIHQADEGPELGATSYDLVDEGPDVPRVGDDEAAAAPAAAKEKKS